MSSYYRHSIVQVIEHSQVWRDEFGKYCQDVDNKIGKNIKAVKAAKHRHESFAKPRGRFVLYLDAFITVAEHMIADRSGKDGRSGADFLMYINEENLLQSAMCADAQHCGLSLTRFLDSEDVEKADIPDKLADFVDMLDLLFVKGKCTEVTGFTSFMIAGLKLGSFFL